MNLEINETFAVIGMVSGILGPLIAPIIKKIFLNRLKEEEFEEERKPGGSYRTKRRKKYK